MCVHTSRLHSDLFSLSCIYFHFVSNFKFHIFLYSFLVAKHTHTTTTTTTTTNNNNQTINNKQLSICLQHLPSQSCSIFQDRKGKTIYHICSEESFHIGLELLLDLYNQNRREQMEQQMEQQREQQREQQQEQQQQQQQQ